MTTKRISLVALTLAFAVLFFMSPVAAIVVEVTHEDVKSCDFLSVPQVVDELGINFPVDELIEAVAIEVQTSACPPNDSTGFPNVQVEMTNLTDRSFTDVWYVADPETSISNVDGLVNGMPAFRIDTVGINRPLVGESIAANGIFEPGELWMFIIDDYVNQFGLPASAFLSQGLVGSVSGMDDISSGSIIAIPEPGASVTLLLSCAGWLLSVVGRRSAE